MGENEPQQRGGIPGGIPKEWLPYVKTVPRIEPRPEDPFKEAKAAALRIIGREETVPRGPYCGAIGWIDADARRAELAVGIRTFWWDDASGGTLRFGTGAGITWGSDPHAEWRETELKARRLITLASADTIGP